jgi:type IV pilus assembly protein PilC
MSKGRQLKTVVVPTASKAGGYFKLTSMGKPKKQKSAKNQPMKKITAKMPTTKQKIEKAPAAPPFFRKFNELLSSIFTIPLSEKLFFTENLRVMVKAGLSISEALETLALQTKNKKFKKVLQSVSEGVTGGNSLGSMLEQYPKIFPEYFINMVKVGEVSGNLEQNLEQLSLQMKKDHDLMSKIRGAMIYPAVILAATVGIVILMFVYVIPSVMSIFEDMKIQLPLATRILIAISKTLTDYGALVALGALLAAVALFILARTEKGKKINHFLLLRLWILGPIVHKVNLARFSRTLSSLLKTDIPVTQSFEITATILGNIYYRRACENVAEELAKGAAINSILRKTPNLFPPLVTQMILVGEKSGTLDELLGELAVFYEDEVSDITKNLSSIIEPILIVFLGGVVALIALAIISPIYTLTQNI